MKLIESITNFTVWMLLILFIVIYVIIKIIIKIHILLYFIGLYIIFYRFYIWWKDFKYNKEINKTIEYTLQKCIICDRIINDSKKLKQIKINNENSKIYCCIDCYIKEMELESWYKRYIQDEYKIINIAKSDVQLNKNANCLQRTSTLTLLLNVSLPFVNLREKKAWIKVYWNDISIKIKLLINKYLDKNFDTSLPTKIVKKITPIYNNNFNNEEKNSIKTMVVVNEFNFNI